MGVISGVRHDWNPVSLRNLFIEERSMGETSSVSRIHSLSSQPSIWRSCWLDTGNTVQLEGHRTLSFLVLAPLPLADCLDFLIAVVSMCSNTGPWNSALQSTSCVPGSSLHCRLFYFCQCLLCDCTGFWPGVCPSFLRCFYLLIYAHIILSGSIVEGQYHTIGVQQNKPQIGQPGPSPREMTPTKLTSQFI